MQNHLNYMQDRVASFEDCLNHAGIIGYLYFEHYACENYLP